jgi:Calponin homology (CH) domain
MLSSKEVETLEVKKYIKWIEHSQVKGVPQLSEESIWQDLTDGLVLLRICDCIKQGSVNWSKVNDPATNSFKKMDNCAYLLTVCKDLGIPSEGINPKEIVQAFHKSQLNALWLIMRQSFIIIHGAQNEEEIKKLAQQFEAFAHSTLIASEDCEFDPLMQVLYYGDEGEVFSVFHDEADLDCPKLPLEFDHLNKPVSNPDLPLFTWLRGHVNLDPSWKLTKNSRSKNMDKATVAHDAQNEFEPKISHAITSNPREYFHSPVDTDQVYELSPSVPQASCQARLTLKPISANQKSRRAVLTDSSSDRSTRSTADQAIILSKPSLGMIADDVNEDVLYLAPLENEQKDMKDPRKPISNISEQYGVGLLRTRSGVQNEIQNGIMKSQKSRTASKTSSYESGVSTRLRSQESGSQYGKSPSDFYPAGDITLDLNTNIWMKQEPTDNQSWERGEQNSGNQSIPDQDSIAVIPFQDTSTQLVVSEILDEFDRSQWNKYLEPYVSILSPPSQIASSREKLSHTRFNPDVYSGIKQCSHFFHQPFYFRMKNSPNSQTVSRLAKVHNKFLGSHYHDIFGKLYEESEYLHAEDNKQLLQKVKDIMKKLSPLVQSNHFKSVLRILENVATIDQVRGMIDSTDPSKMYLGSRDALLFRRILDAIGLDPKPKLTELQIETRLSKKAEYLDSLLYKSLSTQSVKDFHKQVTLFRMQNDPQLTLLHVMPAWRLLENWVRSCSDPEQRSEQPNLKDEQDRKRLGMPF